MMSSNSSKNCSCTCPPYPESVHIEFEYPVSIGETEYVPPIPVKFEDTIRYARGGLTYDLSTSGLVEEPQINQYEHYEDSDVELLAIRAKLLCNIREMSSWGTHGIDDHIWCDEKRPFPKLFTYTDLELTDEENSGILSKRVIASCLSYLEKCPESSDMGLFKCVLDHKSIKDMSQLNNYINLQYIDLSWNNITDLTPLEGLCYLMYLDVSHNEITELLNFTAPKFLTFVNYSYNLLTKIPDLSKFWSLKALNLSHNNIEVIEGLDTLQYLEKLNISFNKIKLIENLDNMRIMFLDLQYNEIDSFDCGRNSGFKTMTFLSYVRIGNNHLTSLRMFDKATFLQSLDIKDNNISDLMEISYLRDLHFLVYANFTNNPIRTSQFYHMVCFETIRSLRFLDEKPIKATQKVHAEEKLSPSIEIQAAKDFGELIALSHLSKFPNLGLDVIPANQPPKPLVIVVGILGCRHEMIVKKFADLFPESVTRLVMHTSRPRDIQETDGSDYHFIPKQAFEGLLENGEMLMMYEVFNQNYGLTQDEFAKGIESNKVMILHTDLHAALVLRLRGFQPMLVLALPRLVEVHREFLVEDYELCVFDMKHPEAAIEIHRKQKIAFGTETSLASWNSNIPSRICEAETETLSTFDITQNMVPSTAPISTVNSDVNDSTALSDEQMTSRVNDTETVPGKSLNSSDNNIDNYPITSSANSEAHSQCGTLLGVHFEIPMYTQSNETFDKKDAPRISQELAEKFYASIFEMRDVYLKFHRSHPGIFYEIIFTDECDNCLTKLKHVVIAANNAQELAKPLELEFKDELYHNFIEERFKMFEEDIERSLKKPVTCALEEY